MPRRSYSYSRRRRSYGARRSYAPRRWGRGVRRTPIGRSTSSWRSGNGFRQSRGFSRMPIWNQLLALGQATGITAASNRAPMDQFFNGDTTAQASVPGPTSQPASDRFNLGRQRQPLQKASTVPTPLDDDDLSSIWSALPWVGSTVRRREGPVSDEHSWMLHLP